jgi:hypothetical protein
MTKKSETQKFVTPLYHVFLDGADGNSRYAGVAYKHKKGNGCNIIIGGVVYSAFPPKENVEEEESA